MRYYIADCHFYHRALLNSMDHRGFQDVDEMNAYMIKQWNEKVIENKVEKGIEFSFIEYTRK